MRPVATATLDNRWLHLRNNLPANSYSVPIIIVRIVMLLLTSQSGVARTRYPILFSHPRPHKNVRPQQPRLQISRGEVVGTISQTLKPDDPINGNTVYERQHARQNLDLELCDQERRVLDVDAQEPRVEMPRRKSLHRAAISPYRTNDILSC